MGMSPSDAIQYILLKSATSPTQDPYTLALNALSSTPPIYIPVLSHTLRPDALIKLFLRHIDPKSPYCNDPFPFGALILSSQRAVATLNTALTSPALRARIDLRELEKIQIQLYTVGPATATAARQVQERALRQCTVLGGSEAGNGAVLADMILAQYTDVRPLLFLAGETRRDIIPRKLKAGGLSVEIMVVYESVEMEGFEHELGMTVARLREADRTDGARMRWILVFSPTGGKGLLKVLGWLDPDTGKIKANGGQGDRVEERRDFVCCIGPTTQAYLLDQFGCRADVVAATPSPSGVVDGIKKFMACAIDGPANALSNVVRVE